MTPPPTNPFESLSTPAPRAELRALTLEAAAVSVPESGPRAPGWLDRCWNSRSLRLAWITVVAILCVAHLQLARTTVRAPERSQLSAQPASEPLLDELVEELAGWHRPRTEPVPTSRGGLWSQLETLESSISSEQKDGGRT